MRFLITKKEVNKMSKRITARISDDLNAKLDSWCAKLGVNKGQLAGICITAGFDAVIRAVSPVDSLNDEQLKRIVTLSGLSESEVLQAIEKKS